MDEVIIFIHFMAIAEHDVDTPNISNINLFEEIINNEIIYIIFPKHVQKSIQSLFRLSYYGITLLEIYFQYAVACFNRTYMHFI